MAIMARATSNIVKIIIIGLRSSCANIAIISEGL